MDLAELVGLRPVPCGGLLVTLTRRCPLSCAHCSTDSSPATAQRPDPEHLLRFVGSFGAHDRPEVVMLTGGEPLLLPELAARLATLARARGSRVALLSGMFFARGGHVPDRIMRAITALDHFSASMDVHHEREVPRAAVLGALRAVLDAGIPASVHLTGTGPDDPYVADAVADVRRAFADRVPLLVNEVRPVGRGARLVPASPPGPDASLTAPCTLAAWPVVAFDGTVAACCNQWTVDRRPVPAHLRLGHIADDDWPAVRARSLGSPVLRMLRSVGPRRLHARYGTSPAPDGYCRSCHALADRPEVLAGAARDADGRVGELLDRLSAQAQLAAGPAALVRRMGCAAYAHLIEPRPAQPAQSAHVTQSPQPVQLAQPVQSTPPVQLAQPAHVTQSVQPMQPMQPVQPVQSAQPAHVTQSAQPMQPMQPVQPVQPMQSAPPVQLARSPQSAPPVQSAQSAQERNPR